MAITFVGKATGDSSIGSNQTLTLPVHAIDDYAVILMYSDQDTGVHTITGSTWTKIEENLTPAGRDMHTSVWVRRFTSASESNPVCTTSNSEEFSASVHIFRGVDTSFGHDGITFASSTNVTSPEGVLPAGITTGLDGACGLRMFCMSHDDISAAGTPTGYALGADISGAVKDFRQQVVAYNLNLGTSGKYSATPFSHTLTANVAEYHTFFMILSQPVNSTVTDFNTTETFDWADTGLFVTGTGFGATQGTGKVEFWSDLAGTIKTSQTVDVWGDTSIKINTVQGSLPSNENVYLVITNNAGDESTRLRVTEGVAPYGVIVQNLNPDHQWELDNSYTDNTGVNDMTASIVGTHSFVTTAICEENTYAWELNGVTERRGVADNADMNQADHDERTVGGWIMFTGIQQSVGCIYKEGGTTSNLSIITGMGNTVMAQMAQTGAGDDVQSYADMKLAPNRPYHVAFRYSYTETTKEMLLFIDGQEQTQTRGNPLTASTMPAHPANVTWGDPDTNLDTGGADVDYPGQEGCQYAQWASWSTALNKTTELRDKLFRLGALPDDEIASGTESAMQTALDAFASATRPDWPLSFRVNAVTGGGNFELVADAIVFADEVSMQLQYVGDDILTWVNENGSNLDAAKVFVTGAGSVTIIESVAVTVTVKDISTDTVIVGARVLIEADSGGPLTAGDVIVSGVTDSLGQITANLRYSASQPYTCRVRKASTGILYITTDLSGTIGSKGAAISALMVQDQ